MEDIERPKYYHLLSDADLSVLDPVLRVLKERREEVLARFYALYLTHFGEVRTLAESDFRELYGRDVDAVVHNVLNRDLEGFAADVRSVGFDMVERGVPFAEIVVSLHLFEEVSLEAFRPHIEPTAAASRVYQIFDKLSHCRIILLAGTYFEGYRDSSTQRLAGLEQEVERLSSGPGPSRRTRFHGLIGVSAAMQRVYEQIAAAAGGQGAVLLVGESGTGKELVARALHERSQGADRPFVAVNCAALPRELIESELFGYRKGAYTGAGGEYGGLVRAAAGGTLFLDEITEMSAEVQAKLLRVLEERSVRPVGGAQEVPVDVRFVASTNRDPEKAVTAGLLRQDLYFRLNVHRLNVPPLRERLDDIALLCEHFAGLFHNRGMRRVDAVEQEALAVLTGYMWPGNVRELRNAIDYALTVGKGTRLRVSDLPQHVVQGARPVPAGAPPLAAGVPTMEEGERDLILRALDATGGNKLQAARLLRISRHRLYDKLRKFGIGEA